MKHTKRILSVLLAVVLLLGVVPVMNVGITASAVSINDLKAQYPAGKYWNGGDASTCTSSPCTHHNGNCTYSGSCGCNTFKGHAIQCMGFAYQLASLVYGGDPYVERTANQSTSALDSLKAGDIITYKNGGHTIFVTGVEGDTITFADCNSDYQCGIRWDETISKSKVRSTFKYVDPAPYEWMNGSSAPDTSHNPVGDVNDCSGGRSIVYIKGWVYDPDTITENSNIHVYIGGNVGSASAEAYSFLADKAREDVDGTYHCGAFHGFEETIATRLNGIQPVYIWAINTGEGQNVLLGEFSVNIDPAYDPQGDVDVCVGGAGYVWIKGWVFDQDQITESSYIHVYIGEGEQREAYSFLANKARVDVDEAHHCGAFHGFEETIVTQLRNVQRVCIWGINVGSGTNKMLYDGYVTISPPYNPVGDVNDCSGENSVVYIKGWAFDQDNLLEQLNIHVYIGEGANQEAYGTIVANKERTDVDDTYHCGAFHGFEETIQTNLSGNQKVSIWAINYWLGENVLLWEGVVYITPHTHSYTSKVTTAATCTTAGVRTYTCSCGASYSETITALGHSYGAWTKLNDTQHQRVCSRNSSHVEKANHTWNAGTVTKAATCTSTGIRTYTCSVCGGTKTETISINASNHINTTNVDATASTCTVKGYTAGVYCNDCKKYISGHQEQPLAAHTLTTVNQRNATCTAEGYTGDRYCTTCKQTISTGTAIGKTAHTLTVINQRDVTYDAEGYTGDQYCTTCKQTITTGTAIPKLVRPTDPTPTDPQPSNPQPSGGCKWCGQNHGGAFGWLVKIIHNFLAAIFGAKY
ncbi:MAG: hypothetical protein IKN72_11630 [Clostridia bacterium]|nr:hypothetical protein [Clostridia bacterium]